jgi:hypothetical protein
MKNSFARQIFVLFMFSTLLSVGCVHETKNLHEAEAPKIHPGYPCETFYRSESIVTENFSKRLVVRYKVHVNGKKGFLACEKIVKPDLNKTCEVGGINAIDLEFIPMNMKNVVARKSGACRLDENMVTKTKSKESKLQYVATTKMRLHRGQ